MDDSRAASTATVSEHDRDYMRRLGRWKQLVRNDMLAEHLALPPRERLIAAFVLMVRGQYFEPRSPRPDRGPAEFYERARRLGLYKG